MADELLTKKRSRSIRRDKDLFEWTAMENGVLNTKRNENEFVTG